MTLLINQICFAWYNVLNAYGDSVRIKQDKTINHFINGMAYLLYVFFVILIDGHFNFSTLVLTPLSAFCNRQLSFDIPLNLMRKPALKWDYVSKEPKSVIDRLEIRIFGYNGRAPVVFYSAILILTIIINSII